MNETYAAFLRLVVLHGPGTIGAEAARCLATGNDSQAARRVGPMSRYLPLGELTADERATVAEAADLASGQEPQRGRPEVGPRVLVRLPPEVLEHVDAWADAEGVTRAEAIRRLLTAALDGD